ncbi:MAG: 50S ribosomal protein L21, partial [Pseudomonadota bacterium]
MVAVFKTGGKQYRAAKGDILKVEKLTAEVGSVYEITDVLMHTDGGKTVFGTPFLSDMVVACEVVAHARARKIMVFKKKRRQNYRRLKGHRQAYTQLRILGVTNPGGGAKLLKDMQAALKKATTDVARATKEDAAPKKVTAKKAEAK